MSKSTDFSSKHEDQLKMIQDEMGEVVQKIEKDAVECPVLWVQKDKIADFLSFVKKSDGLEYEFLSDLTAYDELGSDEEAHGRFVLVYSLYSPNNKSRMRVKVSCQASDQEGNQEGIQEKSQEKTSVPTITAVWTGANWAEREVFDMFGIRFSGHPDLRRILMDARWVGHPLRKDYDLHKTQLFADAEPIPAQLLLEAQVARQNDDADEIYADTAMLINIGPSHPATHGTLRIMARINGETIEKSVSEMGYLHRGKEKIAEHGTYHQFIVHTDRMNYCSPLCNNVVYAMAVERLMGLEIPERTKYIRTICIEISRVIDHLICLGINAVDLGAFSFFLYGFHQREEAYTLIEMLCGARLTTSYTRIGGLACEPPKEFIPALKKWIQAFRPVFVEMDKLLTNNKIWQDRTIGVGAFTKEQAMRHSFTGPCARASNVNIDLRRDQPESLLKYDEVEFDVPLGKNGDVYDRYLVRMEEVRQSLGILEQLADKCPEDGPIWVEDKRVVIPAKDRVYNSMEAMIHHFKFFMEGFDVPTGEAYTCAEGPNGELGFYIASKGGPQPWRMRVRAPSFWLYQSLDTMVKGEKIADLIAALGSLNIIAGELDR